MSWFHVSYFRQTAQVAIKNTIGVGAETAELLSEIESAKEVELLIDSGGGCSKTADEVYRAIKGRCTLATITGCANSAAALISLAADRVLIAPDAEMMLHAPRVQIAMLSAPELRAMADWIERQTAQWLDRLMDRTNVDVATAAKWLNGHDEHFDAQRAVDVGLAHEIRDIPPSEPIIEPVPDESGNEREFLNHLLRFGSVRTTDTAKLRRELSAWAAMSIREVSR